jgi:hypothetical protein
LTDCRRDDLETVGTSREANRRDLSRTARGLKYSEFLIVVGGALLGTYFGRRILRSPKTDLRRRRIWSLLGLVGCALVIMLLLPWLL